MLETNYFSIAKSWQDDIHTTMIQSRHRYQVAFFTAMALAALLAIALCLLVPLQDTKLVIVHQNDNGVVWVEPGKQHQTSVNQSQIESDLVRYIINRESFCAATYDHQYQLTNILSSKQVAKTYQQQQSASNKLSFIARLGQAGKRKVFIENIAFLKPQKPDQATTLAQVNFAVEERPANQSVSVTEYYTALIRWNYLGEPKNPSIKWQNWNGFSVTTYQVNPRQVYRKEAKQ